MMSNDSKLFIIYIFLTTNNCYEPLLLCLWDIHVFSSMKYLFSFFFFWSIFLLNLLLSSFYLQEFFCTYFLILFCLLVENILFQFVVSFYFLYVYFDEQRFLILMWLNLAVSSFIIIIFWALLEKFFPILRS